MLFYVRGGEAEINLRRRRRVNEARTSAEAELRARHKAQKAAKEWSSHFDVKKDEQSMLGLPEQGKEVIRAVCAARQISIWLVLSPVTHREMVEARHEIMFRLKHDCGWSRTEVAQRLKRDHSSVGAGIQKHLERMRRAQ